MKEKLKNIFKSDPYKFSYKDLLGAAVIGLVCYIAIYAMLYKSEFGLKVLDIVIVLPSIVLTGLFIQEGGQMIMDKLNRNKAAITQALDVKAVETTQAEETDA